MALPPIPWIVAGVGALAFTGYELATRVFKGKEHHHHDGPPAGPPGDQALSSTVPTPVDGGPAPAVVAPQATTPGVVTAASPNDGGPPPGGGVPGVPPHHHRHKPRPPGLRRFLHRPSAPSPLVTGVPAVVGGLPVMSGDSVRDLLHLLAFHGYRKSDMPVIMRAQHALGLKPDGMPGPMTWAALQRAASAKGIAMPRLPPWSPTLPQWLVAN
jgi:hypothetical protein